MSGNTQHMRLFRKSTSQTINCWTSVTCRAGDDKFISANMDVVFSKAAKEKFDKLARESKTKGTDMVDAKVTHSWIKAMVDREGKPVTDILGHVVNCVFVNDFEVWNKEKL